MNRSRKALLVTLGLVALLPVLYYIYNYYFGPQRYRLEAVGEPQEWVLEKKAGQGPVYAIELEFQGNLSGDATVFIGADNQEFYAKTLLKAGRIDSRFTSDWYYDNLPLRYVPNGPVEGKLTVRYRFISN